jgi:hypothetical protein
LTKKDFIALADFVKRLTVILVPYHSGDGTYDHDVPMIRQQDVYDMLADFCAQQNPNFNRQRWLGYIAGLCGPNGGKVGR